MPLVEEHPPFVELAAFAVGRLDDALFDAVESHVAVCAECEGVVARITGDTFTELLRSAQSLSDTPLSLAAAATVGPISGVGKVTGAWAPPDTTGPPDLPAALLNNPRYSPLRQLGSGGMGAVWLAEHAVMKRRVAVKVIRPEFLTRDGAAERFQREVQVAARLHHPNIVTAFDAERSGDSFLLAMEYIDGVSLADYLRQKGPLPIVEACDCIRQAALGLHYAHEQGLIHRDLKPHNLMRTPDGTVKILDFGLAAVVDQRQAAGGITGSNILMGTPDYIAPEQAEDARTADVRSDIYSLGCTLYHLLAGRVPFPDESILNKLIAHRQDAPAALRTARPEIPAELAAVVAKMMAKTPAARYQTAAEVVAALEPFTRARLPIPPRRNRWLVAAAALFLFGVVAAAGVVVYRIQTDKGELVIETVSDDVEVVVKQGGKLVEIMDMKTKKKITLHSGVYDLELKGGEGLKLDIDKAALTRGGKVLAKIERVMKPPPSPPDNPKDSIRLVHRVDWRTDGVLSGDVARGGRFFLGQVGHVSGLPRGCRVWDGETGKFLWDHNNSHTAHFSPDGEQVYVLERDPTNKPWTRPEKCIIRAYRTTTGAFVRTVCRMPNFIHWFHISPDGKYLATISGRYIGVWSVAEGKLLREWGDHEGFSFTPDGKHITMKSDGEQRRRIYRLPTLEEIQLPDPLAAFDWVSLQPGGRYAIARELNTTDKSLWLIDAEGRKIHRWLPRSYGKSLDQLHWINGRESLVMLDDGTFRLFDVVTQQERACFRFPQGERSICLELSPDRSFVIALTNKGAVLLFRMPDPLPDKELPKFDPAAKPEPKPAVAEMQLLQRKVFPQRGGYCATAVAPDGKLFSASWSGSYLVVWDGRTGNELYRVKEAWHDFTQDGSRLVAADLDRLRVHDARTGKLLHQIPLGDWPNAGVYLLPGSRHALARTSTKKLYLADLLTGTLLQTWPSEEAGTWTADGKTLFFKPTGEKKYLAWDLQKNQRSEEYPQPLDTPPETKLARTTISIRYSDGKLRLWDNLQKKECAALPLLNNEELFPNGDRVALSADSRYACVMTTFSVCLVRLPDLSTTKEPPKIDPVAKPAALESLWNINTGWIFTNSPVVFSPDGKRILVSCFINDGNDADIRSGVWDSTTGKQLARGNWGGSTAFLPDGKQFLAYSDYTVRVHDTETAKILRSFDRKHPGHLWSLSISPDGKYASTAGKGDVYLWDVAKGKLLRSWLQPESGPNLFLPGQDRAITFNDGSPNLLLMSLPSGAVKPWFPVSKLGCFSGSFPPLAQVFVLCSGGVLSVHNLATGEKLREIDLGPDLPGESGQEGIFSPDGRFYIVCDRKGFVRLWSLTSVQEVARSQTSWGKFRGASFTRDGRLVVTAHDHGALNLWRVPKEPVHSR